MMRIVTDVTNQSDWYDSARCKQSTGQVIKTRTQDNPIMFHKKGTTTMNTSSNTQPQSIRRALSQNHNQTLVKSPAKPVQRSLNPNHNQTMVKVSAKPAQRALTNNHNQTMVKASAKPVQRKLNPNHNQTLVKAAIKPM